MIIRIACVVTFFTKFNLAYKFSAFNDGLPNLGEEGVKDFISSVQNYEQFKIPSHLLEANTQDFITDLENNQDDLTTQKKKRRRRKRKKRRKKPVASNKPINQNSAIRQHDIRIPSEDLTKFNRFLDKVCKTAKSSKVRKQCRRSKTQRNSNLSSVTSLFSLFKR